MEICFYIQNILYFYSTLFAIYSLKIYGWGSLCVHHSFHRVNVANTGWKWDRVLGCWYVYEYKSISLQEIGVIESVVSNKNKTPYNISTHVTFLVIAFHVDNLGFIFWSISKRSKISSGPLVWKPLVKSFVMLRTAGHQQQAQHPRPLTTRPLQT